MSSIAGALAAPVAVMLVLAAVLFASPIASAHHSFAMFDFNNTVTITGTVKEFRWTNPHVILLVNVPQKAGDPEVWSMELTSPGNLTRLGWSRRSFRPGDRIQLEFNPLRDGKHGGAFRKATLLDSGQVLTSNLREAEKPGLQ
ncbi:MAG TPA: DUF6152 family protein [Steroidobacteraceae bacterium]|nr:DUF6152 family protein [Steroidobacteraceae bacterium]